MYIVKTEIFRNAAEAIARLEPDPFTGTVTADQIKVAIAEYLDVWPESVADDLTDDEVEFIEDGSEPIPEPDFISEEEDRNPFGIEKHRTA